MVKKKLFYDLPKYFLGVFHYFSHHSRVGILFALLLLSIQNLNLTIRCVSWKQLMSVMNHHMYVCACLKVSVNYGQQVRGFFIFFFIKVVYMILRILNLEGQQNCIISSKVTTFGPTVKKKINK